MPFGKGSFRHRGALPRRNCAGDLAKGQSTDDIQIGGMFLGIERRKQRWPYGCLDMTPQQLAKFMLVIAVFFLATFAIAALVNLLG